MLAISGLGCGHILAPETGLHVLEHVEGGDRGERVVEREHVRVVVASRAPGPRHGGRRRSPSAARSAIDAVDHPGVVVRQYRPGKSPLVRDGVRGYRTGRLDDVFAGDFDLF